MQVAAFSVATTPVTNQEFAEFCGMTGYETIASRTGGLWFFGVSCQMTYKPGSAGAGTPWWRVVAGRLAHPWA